MTVTAAAVTDFEFGPRYTLVRELGSGGSGHVFLVDDTYLGRQVALKVLRPGAADEDSVELLQREFALLSHIEHPGIARAFDFGYSCGRAFLTQEFIAGRPLDAPELSLDALGGPGGLLEALAEPLAFLHDSGILHLDVKPSNVMLAVGSRRGGRRPVLIDFGLFRRALGARSGAAVRGTLPFMAPEYFRDGALGPWTDVYALGVTLYRLVTGVFPRAAPRTAPEEEARGVVEVDWETAPSPPSRLPGASCSDELDDVILKCLALEPRARFASAAELLGTLRATPRARSSSPIRGVELAAGVTLGRARELDAVECHLERVRDRDGALAMLVTGAPGVGQSHFLREVKIRAQTSGWRLFLEAGYRGRARPPGSLLRFLVSVQGAESRARWSDFLDRIARPRASEQNETTESERRQRWAVEVTRAARNVRDPVALVVDGLQFWDEVSLTLLLSLIKYLASCPAEERPPLALVLGHREEGPSEPLLRELGELLFREESAESLTLPPLDLETTWSLYRQRGGDAARSRLGLLQTTGGLPARIAELAAHGHATAGAGAETDAGDRGREPISMTSEQAALLAPMVLLGRPAGAVELSRVAERPRERTRRVLAELEQRRAVRELDGPGGAEWIAEPAAESVVTAMPARARRLLHRRIAEQLVAVVGDDAGAELVEAVRHFEAAGARTAVAKHGRRAARYLSSTLQSRRALELYASALEATPRGDVRARLRIALEMAELHGRTGSAARGIELLKGLLPEVRERSVVQHGRTVLRLATLHCRRGEFRRADALFREGFRLVESSPASLDREEELGFLNEHAAMKAFVGEYEQARALCDRGLELARDAQSIHLREVALNLLATRANVALRTYDYESAVSDFEVSLDIAETIGSETNRAVVLNNLGIVYAQCDRHADAIRAYLEAERTCMRLDEGPSLVSIYGNLAVLYAKTGDFESARVTCARALDLNPGEIGPRQEFFLRHSLGLCLINEGRHADAIAPLDDAIRLGERMGDAHVAAFDRAYRGEACIFAGKPREAYESLSALDEEAVSARVRGMALARRALLAAPGDAETSRDESDAPRNDVMDLVARHDALDRGPAVPFLDAWDELYLGWGLCRDARDEGAVVDGLARLERAIATFRRLELAPALSMALCARAEALIASSAFAEATELLGEVGERSGEYAAILALLLRAELALRDTETDASLAGVSDLLAEAGVRLMRAPSAALEARKLSLRAGLEARGAGGAPGAGGATTGEPGTDSTRTIELARRGAARPFVALSRPMARLMDALDRIRESDLPVLIRGETGSGKELVARTVHDESARATGPFVVVDCPAIPPPLMEVELFGARAGAFTGIEESREGLLSSAAGGTVFVDGVAGLPLALQAKLLRVLSSGGFRPVGADRELRVDVRFIFSSSDDLEERARDGRLREDLLHRIRVVTLDMPPLRERQRDFAELVRAFARDAGFELADDAVEFLSGLPWPGNVRELENFVARVAVHAGELTGPLTRGRVEALFGDPRTRSIFPGNVLESDGLDELQRRLERDYIIHHFRRLAGDTSALAEFLGIGRRQLYRRCERLGVSMIQERRRLRPE